MTEPRNPRTEPTDPPDGVIPQTEPASPSSTSPETNPGTCELCTDLPHRQLTHCTRCHASWTRTSRTMHCCTCHKSFGSLAAADAHLLRVGCTDPAGVRTKKTGEPVFGEPRLNIAGTLVWRMSGEAWDRSELRTGPGAGTP